jgi:hypothetical protein
MYDVSDGQMRFDTIRIADNKGGWRQADIRTFASNVWWPETNVFGIEHGAGFVLTMPRRWFGNARKGRNVGVTEYPLNPANSTHFRTIGHEFGHYIGLFDEYFDSLGAQLGTPPR